MELSLWALALLTCKLSIYLGFVAVVGGVTTLLVFGSSAKMLGCSLDRYLWLSTGLALLSTILAFFVQVGALADSGFSGMWHPLFRTILWNSAVGESTLWRGLGFALMLVVLATLLTSREFAGAGWLRILMFVFWIIALYPLVFSFSLVGHVAELNLLAQLALSLHVLAIAWWMGALWPLWLSCKKLDQKSLYRIMHRFGQMARYAVALLIGSGVLVVIQLLDSISALWVTEYGRILSIKLVGVSAILLLALFHKMRLVPALLSQPKNSIRLARSIQVELVLGSLILLTTAVLTTLVGPTHAP